MICFAFLERPLVEYVLVKPVLELNFLVFGEQLDEVEVPVRVKVLHSQQLLEHIIPVSGLRIVQFHCGCFQC